MNISLARLGKIGSVALTTLILISCGGGGGAKAPDWSTVGGNREHSGYVPQTVDPKNFAERWVLDLSEGGGLHGVVADSKHVFVSQRLQLHCIDNLDGAIAWSAIVPIDAGVGAPTPNYVSPPSIGGGKVYVQTGHTFGSVSLWAYDIENGEEVFWSPGYGNYYDYVPSLTVDKGVVFGVGGTFKPGAFAVDGENGNLSWSNETFGYRQYMPAVTDQYAIAYGVQGLDSKASLVAQNRETGEPAIEIIDPGYTSSSEFIGLKAPVVGQNGEVLLVQGGRLVSFNLKEAGTIKWEIKNGFSGNPILANGVVYVAANGKLEARREADGQLLWIWGNDAGSVWPRVVMNNLLFAQQLKQTVAVDLKTQQQVWSYPMGGELAVQDGTLYISRGGKLVAMDLLGDADGDGMPTFWEKRYGGNLDPASDKDEDGLTALQEYQNGFNPQVTDTDGDGVLDGGEILQ